MVKTQKEVLSCRIPQELKHKLEADAMSEGTTTSNYVEQLILNHQNGEHITDSREEEYLQQIEQLESRLAAAEQTRVHYENRLVESEQEVLSLTEERDSFETAYDETAEMVEVLQRQVSTYKTASTEKEVRIAELESKETLNFLSAERANFSDFVSTLEEHYPEATKEQIILGSLYAAAQNEQPVVFIVSRIKNYLKTL